MVAADELGYHSVWIAEHHFSDYGVCSAPQVLAAAIAARTRRLRVGMGIVLLPLHDPVQIAEELAVLDHVSDGRLDVGIGRASTPLEYSGYGVRSRRAASGSTRARHPARRLDQRPLRLRRPIQAGPPGPGDPEAAPAAAPARSTWPATRPRACRSPPATACR